MIYVHSTSKKPTLHLLLSLLDQPHLRRYKTITEYDWQIGRRLAKCNCWINVAI